MSLSVNIEKRLGAFTLRADFEAKSGETLALLGASGSGKSVTLRCIAGIMTPDRGRIVLDGETLFDSDAHIDLPPQKRRVGYLFQQYALFPTMTVAQNVRCALRLEERSVREERTNELLRRFRLAHLAEKYPDQLSGGEQQRTALARIFASRPRAILLDEPLSALDASLRWELELALGDLLAGFSGPLIWVSHDLGEVCRNCGAVCTVENGTTAAVTDFDTLLHRPASLGSARLALARTQLSVRRDANGVTIDGWGISLPLPLAAEEGVLALPDDAAVLGSGPFCARVERTLREADGVLVLLRPENGAGPLLRAKAGEGFSAAAGEKLSFGLRRERCFLYEKNPSHP